MAAEPWIGGGALALAGTERSQRRPHPGRSMLCSPASVSLRRRVKPGARQVVVRRSQNMNAIMILNDAPVAEIISEALLRASDPMFDG